jgi:hypothetical protein
MELREVKEKHTRFVDGYLVSTLNLSENKMVSPREEPPYSRLAGRRSHSIR